MSDTLLLHHPTTCYLVMHNFWKNYSKRQTLLLLRVFSTFCPIVYFQVTHSVLLSKNLADQTLLTLIEVNRESLSESLPLVLKKEYGCHRRDIAKTELCLSSQLESSASAAEINKELKELEPKSCCAIFKIWAILFLTSLTLNIGLCALDIISDSYLSIGKS